MPYQLTKSSDLKTATWAGGTTTQLSIFPVTAEYTKFNFDFRISFATVEVDKSTFTFMPGVTRHLMITKGSLLIDHTDRYRRQLNKFDVDIFSGEWPTQAEGKVTDFNLMTRGTVSGEIKALEIDKEEFIEINNEDYDYIGFYLLTGMLTIKRVDEEIKLQQGDFILFKDEIGQFDLSGLEATEVIISLVKI